MVHLARGRLVVLLNALFDEGVTSVGVEHPAEAVGELVRIELGGDGEATVRFSTGTNSYRAAREAVPARHGEVAYEDLPDANTYTRAAVASGPVALQNHDEVLAFVDRHGYPDLAAGHEPVVLGLDTNLMPWRLPAVLDVHPDGTPDAAGRRPTNGYALATGVEAELDWYYRQEHARDLTTAFGEEFTRLAGQPAGANREGFLGRFEYRRLRGSRTVDVIECEEGDEAIVEAYADYDATTRKRPLLLSNDHGFVDRAVEAGLAAQHVAYPVDLPRTATGTWREAGALLYHLAVLFGVLSLPKVTLYGVWDGKTSSHWQDEALDVDCRSPAVESRLARDLAILEAGD